MASASQVRIPSRTAEGKHTKRFIVEVHSVRLNTWQRSGKYGLTGYFATREEAQDAINPANGLASGFLTYRVRQK